jgi:hypothetical protein
MRKYTGYAIKTYLSGNSWKPAGWSWRKTNLIAAFGSYPICSFDSFTGFYNVGIFPFDSRKRNYK